MRKSLSTRLALSVAIAATLSIYGCGGGSGSDPGAVTSVTGSGFPVPTQNAALPEQNAPGPRFPTSLDGLEGSSTTGESTSPAKRLAKSVQPGVGYTVDTSNREEVRLFYKTVFASTVGVDPGWTGNVSTCNAGDTSADFKASVLRSINWFRAMAGVPAAVEFDPVYNAKAQQAALLMSANRQLSHYPPASWTCYNAVGGDAAGKSNLAFSRIGSQALYDAYMDDSGAGNYQVGHRRWLLYPQTRLMGTGDIVGSGTNYSANAIWVVDSNVSAARPVVRDEFVAWPTKGYTPYKVVYPRWSFSYPKADFSNAKVSMTENGVPITSRMEAVANGPGENTLVWMPGNAVDSTPWAKPATDTVYQVTVSNVAIGGQTRSFSYQVIIFDPDQDTNPNSPNVLSPIATSTASLGQTIPVSFAGISAATDYQWRTMLTAPLTFSDGAESGLSNFIANTSPGYSVITADTSASGSNTFRLAHTQPISQILQLKTKLVGTTNSVLRFKSRLSISSPVQRAKVEASIDEGQTWQVIFQQSGQQIASAMSFGETSFSEKKIPLAQFSNRAFFLRLNYEVGAGGSYYPQSSSGFGWYIDDISLEGFESQVFSGSPVDTTSNSFSFSSNNPGDVLVQARAGMFGYYDAWGPIKRITVDQQAVADSRDCIMNWAEGTYPGTFSISPSSTSQSNAVYYFRYYTANKSAIGFSKEDTVHYLAPGTDTAINIGSKAQWMMNSGCK